MSDTRHKCPACGIPTIPDDGKSYSTEDRLCDQCYHDGGYDDSEPYDYGDYESDYDDEIEDDPQPEVSMEDQRDYLEAVTKE